LRDGIPLNEHFLSLKNKFNNEKDTLSKEQKNLEEDIHKQEGKNQQTQDNIDTKKKDIQAANADFEKLRKDKNKEMRSIETEFYSALHRKTQLTEDKKRLNTHLGTLRQDNHGTDREIARLKKFSKADQVHKQQEEEHKKNTDDVTTLN